MRTMPIAATLDDFARFLKYADNHHDSSRCWNWTGNKHYTGYGRFSIHQVWFQAIRISYNALIGTIPEGMVLDHLCRNRVCVNPFHLQPVTVGENVRRGFKDWKNRTHCKHGHEWNEENTYYYKKGGYKCCRACGREAKHREYIAGQAF